MVRSFEKIPELAMLKEWAIAEFSNTKRWEVLNKFVPPNTIKKITRGELNQIGEEEWEGLIKAIKQFRSPLLRSLLRIKPAWFQTSITTEQLEQMRIMNWSPFVLVANSRKLSDLVSSLEKNKVPSPIHGLLENVNRIRESFDLNKMMGKPIFVNNDRSIPYTLVEGYTRCSAIILSHRAKKLANESIPIILGVSKKISEWRLNDAPNELSLY